MGLGDIPKSLGGEWIEVRDEKGEVREVDRKFLKKFSHPISNI